MRNRLGVVDESRRGHTRATFDLTDYATAAIPDDLVTSFIRIRELDGAGATLSTGPILIVPPPNFFGTGRRNLVLNGTAPDAAGTANNLPDLTDGLIVAFPKFADEVTIENTDSNQLFISFGQGLQEYQLGPESATASGIKTFTESGVDLLYLRSDNAAGTSFVANFALVNGLQS
jgi:hypothetical protein